MTTPYSGLNFRIISLSSLCLLALLFLAMPSQAQRVSLDKIIAVVDEDVILKSELQTRMAEVIQQAKANGQQLPSEAEVSEQVMEALVIESLQMQLANRMSIRFDDDTINRVLGSMAERADLTFDEYVSFLEENGVYRQTRSSVRKELTMRELQRGIVNRRISITGQEIENFLNSEMGRTTMAADYLVDQLLIAVSEDDSSTVTEAKLKYASELVAAIEEGGEFATIRTNAQQQGKFPVTGTNFGWRRLEQIPSLFTELIPEMKIGDVNGPIKAPNGFHVITLTDIRGGTDRLVKQTNLRHILITPNEIRTDEQAHELALSLRKRIEDGETFATLARQNSDDASSVVAGGDLDWINEGGMPPAMEQVIDSLDIGQVSEPFRSEAGWHIAEILDRREEDLSLEYSRSQAENTLRNRKFDLELQNWLIELREGAFVELKD
ncbi:MAG: peptidylprolyl isomerase [Gammaproteobacteria bacterium]|nr:peptidylprolyl isomerase [Gammaproteobacteria bacterium]